jgi:hypothetical protein
MRLYVLVEGQTEEEFVKSVLVPHLWRRRIEVRVSVVETSRDAFGRKRRGGGRRWGKWYCDLKRLTTEQHGGDVRFTTMFDLYGLPKDFPGLCEHASDRDTSRRATRLEETMAAAVDDWRLVPYLQRHEFEALVLAGLPALAGLLQDKDDLAGLEEIRTMIAQSSPEDINDGEDTAPSKRLEEHIVSYRKTFHGPLVVAETGIAALRSKCPRFDAWIAKLEALGGQP